MTDYEWRQDQIRRVGGKIQRQAEENLDKQDKAPIVDMIDAKTGKTVRYKKPVADRLEYRKEIVKPKLSFGLSSLPENWHSKIDWSK